MQPNLIPSKTDDAIAFLSERAQAAVDEAADAEYERRERIEREVTFADLLEQLDSLDPTGCAQFMHALARATRDDLNTIYFTLHGAKEAVIARRLAEPQFRFPMTYCSQCGKELGPGDHGVSHCWNHI